MQRAAITIEGMGCDHCVEAVRRALADVEGVRVERVEIGSAVVSYDPERADPDGMTAAVEEEGYTVRRVGAPE